MGIITLYNVCAAPWSCSTLWGVQYRGGYHEYRGDIISTMGVFSTMKVNLLLFEYPMVLNTLHGTHDIPHMYHYIPHGTKITKDGIPHTTEHPHSTHDILHGTKHPHSTHDIRTCIVITPYGTEHPLWYSRYPP